MATLSELHLAMVTLSELLMLSELHLAMATLSELFFQMETLSELQFI
jgi:hypothetical protein